MDTKLKKYKKNKTYSETAKKAAVVLILILVSVTAACGLGIVWACGGNGENYNGISSMEYKEYTNTEEFRNLFNDLSDAAIKVNIVYKSEGNIRDGKAVNEDEMIAEFKNYYGIVDGVITGNTRITDDYTVEITGAIPQDMTLNYNEYANLVRTKLRDYKNIYIQNQLNDYIDTKMMLDSFKNYYYCIETNDGEYIAGNKSDDTITKLDQYIVLNGEFLSDKMDVYSPYNNETITAGNYKFYAGIPKEFINGDDFYKYNKDFQMRQKLYPIMASVMLISLIVAAILVVYVVRTAGQRESGGEVTKTFTDRIYNDVHFVIVIVGTVILVTLSLVLSGILLNSMSVVVLICTGTGVLCVTMAEVGLGLNWLCSVSRHIKSRTYLYHTLIGSIIRRISETLNGKSFSGWIIGLFAAYSAIIAMLSALIIQSMNDGSGITLLFMLIMLIVIVIAFVVLVRGARALTAVMKSAKECAEGDYGETLIDIGSTNTTFRSFAEDINNIQLGLKKAIEEAIKGERMKTELITNVSHDLKTPLTSIISYADLLDKEELKNENAEKYVDIIVERSVRLKHLIEDLIEASKVSSGNVSVEKTNIDYKQLAFQACGEYEERFAERKLELRFNAEENVQIYADGSHTWRILDNLLSNVVKYAMSNTRVYIDIFRQNGMGVLIIKNTSQHEINYNVENLTERFFRGDASRSTDGSGLGLSIANSLTVLQNGGFEIEADGDLFKVTVTMPLWMEEYEKKE